MKPLRWLQDDTGRFLKRPHYSPEQLDAECERIVSEFLRERRGAVQFPISTEDLTVLIERDAEELDLYADFSSELGEVEGVTEFRRGQKPIVRIAAQLTEMPNRENRLRTTLTHEYGHVHFHNALYQVESKPASLFEPMVQENEEATSPANRCKRDSIVTVSERDWMEWQAGYVCGALLIPITPLIAQICDFRSRHNLPHTAVLDGTPKGRELIREIAEFFHASQEAARVRLLQRAFMTFRDSRALL